MAKVAGNAGHCPGLDSGAVGPSGLKECDVAKDITQRMLGYLAAVGYETKFIQENELQDICDISNNFGADMFVSIHCNSVDNPQANGMEIYTTRGFSNADVLATCIMDQMHSSYPLSDLQVRADWADGDVDKEANFYVLRYTDAPAVLVETAFISNPKEEAILADPILRDKIAAAIARGISDFNAKMK